MITKTSNLLTLYLLMWVTFGVLGVGLFGHANAQTTATNLNQQATTTAPTMTAPTMTVYKTATCGCCKTWVEHADNNGFSNTVKELSYNDIAALKANIGIGKQFQSCHTAVSADGYAFEGHVPSKFIRQFLASPPKDAIGLAVPGMPVGSPGMEYQDKFMPYQIMLLMKDGSSSVYASIDDAAMQY